eukprot:maker-scaffold927_size80360-snap-gene-0.17 protein:Tk12209 transcript:maker-scaffold927_size80360-snap-gene-0.17-mRNA-1 annotation:"flocculation protein flo11 isoform x1"
MIEPRFHHGDVLVRLDNLLQSRLDQSPTDPTQDPDSSWVVSEYTATMASRSKSSSPVPVKGILRVRPNGPCDTTLKKGIRFPENGEEMYEIIGFGGRAEEVGSDDDDDSDDEPLSLGGGTKPGDEPPTPEERNVLNLTQKNTLFNSKAENLCDAGQAVRLGAEKKASPPLITVQPFVSVQPPGRVSRVSPRISELMGPTVTSVPSATRSNGTASSPRPELLQGTVKATGLKAGGKRQTSHAQNVPTETKSEKVPVVRTEENLGGKLPTTHTTPENQVKWKSAQASLAAARLSFLNATILDQANEKPLRVKSSSVSPSSAEAEESSHTRFNSDSEEEAGVNFDQLSPSLDDGRGRRGETVDEVSRMTEDDSQSGDRPPKAEPPAPTVNRKAIKLTRRSPSVSSPGTASILKGTPRPTIIKKDKPKIPDKPQALLTKGSNLVGVGSKYKAPLPPEEGQPSPVAAPRAASFRKKSIAPNEYANIRSHIERQHSLCEANNSISEMTVVDGAKADFLRASHPVPVTPSSCHSREDTARAAECYSSEADAQSEVIFEVNATKSSSPSMSHNDLVGSAGLKTMPATHAHVSDGAKGNDSQSHLTHAAGLPMMRKKNEQVLEEIRKSLQTEKVPTPMNTAQDETDQPQEFSSEGIPLPVSSRSMKSKVTLDNGLDLAIEEDKSQDLQDQISAGDTDAPLERDTESPDSHGISFAEKRAALSKCLTLHRGENAAHRSSTKRQAPRPPTSDPEGIPNSMQTISPLPFLGESEGPTDGGQMREPAQVDSDSRSQPMSQLRSSHPGHPVAEQHPAVVSGGATQHKSSPCPEETEFREQQCTKTTAQTLLPSTLTSDGLEVKEDISPAPTSSISHELAAMPTAPELAKSDQVASESVLASSPGVSVEEGVSDTLPATEGPSRISEDLTTPSSSGGGDGGESSGLKPVKSSLRVPNQSLDRNRVVQFSPDIMDSSSPLILESGVGPPKPRSPAMPYSRWIGGGIFGGSKPTNKYGDKPISEYLPSVGHQFAHQSVQKSPSVMIESSFTGQPIHMMARSSHKRVEEETEEPRPSQHVIASPPSKDDEVRRWTEKKKRSKSAPRGSEIDELMGSSKAKPRSRFFPTASSGVGMSLASSGTTSASPPAIRRQSRVELYEADRRMLKTKNRFSFAKLLKQFKPGPNQAEMSPAQQFMDEEHGREIIEREISKLKPTIIHPIDFHNGAPVEVVTIRPNAGHVFEKHKPAGVRKTPTSSKSILTGSVKAKVEYMDSKDSGHETSSNHTDNSDSEFQHSRTPSSIDDSSPSSSTEVEDGDDGDGNIHINYEHLQSSHLGNDGQIGIAEDYPSPHCLDPNEKIQRSSSHDETANSRCPELNPTETSPLHALPDSSLLHAAKINGRPKPLPPPRVHSLEHPNQDSFSTTVGLMLPLETLNKPPVLTRSQPASTHYASSPVIVTSSVTSPSRPTPFYQPPLGYVQAGKMSLGGSLNVPALNSANLRASEVLRKTLTNPDKDTMDMMQSSTTLNPTHSDETDSTCSSGGGGNLPDNDSVVPTSIPHAIHNHHLSNSSNGAQSNGGGGSLENICSGRLRKSISSSSSASSTASSSASRSFSSYSHDSNYENTVVSANLQVLSQILLEVETAHKDNPSNDRETIQNYQVLENEKPLVETQDFKFLHAQRKSDQTPVTLCISKQPVHHHMPHCNAKTISRFLANLDDNLRIGGREQRAVLVFHRFSSSVHLLNHDSEKVAYDAKDMCHILLQVLEHVKLDRHSANSILVRGTPDLDDANFHRVIMIDPVSGPPSDEPREGLPTQMKIVRQLLRSSHIPAELESAFTRHLEIADASQPSEWQMEWRDLVHFALWGPLSACICDQFSEESASVSGQSDVLSEDDLLKWFNVERAQALQNILQTQGLRQIADSKQLERVRRKTRAAHR